MNDDTHDPDCVSGEVIDHLPYGAKRSILRSEIAKASTRKRLEALAEYYWKELEAERTFEDEKAQVAYLQYKRSIADDIRVMLLGKDPQVLLQISASEQGNAAQQRDQMIRDIMENVPQVVPTLPPQLLARAVTLGFKGPQP